MRIAVVGHLEWVEFVRVDHVPCAGEIVQAEASRSVPAGGGAVAAVQIARWGAETHFFTALGHDALGKRSHAELVSRGVTVHAAYRGEPQRRAVTMIDAERERTIVVIGPRLAARGDDALAWGEIARCDAVYVTAGDAAAVRRARAARVLVATSRVLPLLREAAVPIDALVGSDNDAEERYADGDLVIAPRAVVRTNGAQGGYFVDEAGVRRRYDAVAATVTGDTYGAGDTFAAALTFALGEGRQLAEAVAFASARAAEIVAFAGPYPPE
jgi:ribokinase